MTWMVGIDTGGTFTDLAAVEPERDRRYVTKVPSTPGSPAEGIREALRSFERDCEATLADITFFAHGTCQFGF